MTANEVEATEKKIAEFRKLEERRFEIDDAIRLITEDWKHGPCGQGPFTGNTRESRQIKKLDFHFTPTRGGAPACDLSVDDLFIEAPEMERVLVEMLKKQRAKITVAMEVL